YWLSLITGGLLFAGLASAWNIIGGLGGQFSLGHAVFFGVGAYTVALLQVDQGLSPWLGLVVGALLAALVAAAISWPLFRLRGPFFAIATLALSEVAFALASYFDFTGGPNGVRIPFEDTVFTDDFSFAVLMFCFMAVAVGLSLAIARSRLGYRLRAVRDDQEAAKAGGVDALRTKTTGLVISAALTGAGGGLYAMWIGLIDPPTVLNLSEIGVRLPLMALIGGIGTIAGPVIGALLIQPGSQYLRGELGGAAPGAHLVLLGILLVAFALFFKRGIWGALQTLWRRYGHRG
ncbi:MAG: branched-chain amino acid ABC transporter permease, partial [Solirubrobacterales bacterium]